MSNYTKATDFQAKDSLLTGNPLKIIKGQEINDELNAIQTAIATKADTSSPAFLGTPTAPTQATGNDSTRLATTAFVRDALSSNVYPVGSIYINASVATNPATLFGFGTWVAFGTGRVLVGINSANSIMDTPEETFGSADAVVVSHTHTIVDPGHTHNIGSTINVAGGPSPIATPGTTSSTVSASNTTGITASNTGVSATNQNYQPSIVVYMWKRTA
jgi:hypothetical protein